VLNAAVLEPLGRIDSANTSAWRTHFDVNFFSLVYTIQAALPALRESELGGRIVFVSSGAAVAGTPSLGAYNTSKAAMNSLCRTLSEEEPGVVSVALRPGMVDTPMQTQMRVLGAEHLREQDLKRFIDAHAAGELVKPEDAGNAIAALSLRAPKSLSGQFISWNSDECKALI